jgi:hypothetical protein
MDLVRSGSLAAALRQLVFDHPEIVKLRQRAREATDAGDPTFDESAGLVGVVIGHPEPVFLLRFLNEEYEARETKLESIESPKDSVWAEYLFWNRPAEVREFCDALDFRAYTLVRYLKDRLVPSYAHTNDGHLTPIAHTIWSQDIYYVDPSTGDIYEAGDEKLERRWIGVIFGVPNASFDVVAVRQNQAPPNMMLLPGARSCRVSGDGLGAAAAALGQRRLRKAPKTWAAQAALAKAGIDILMSDLTLKEIAGEIAPFMPIPPKTALQFSALAKLIGRIRQQRMRSKGSA